MRTPNILIVMTDHQRADTVLPENPTLTPHVDALARNGVTFSNAFCPSPHCCPSRATFFTGLYPTRHGVWNNVLNEQAISRGLSDGVRLWSEDLAATGYDLHFSGKWHVSADESPKDRAWTEHFVSAVAGTYHGARWEHFKELAARPEPLTRSEGEILRPGYGTYRLYGPRPDGGDGHDEKTVQAALDVLPSLARGEKPWCLYVGMIGPHDPYLVPQRYLDMYDVNDTVLPPSFSDTLHDKPRIYERMRATRFGQLSEKETCNAIRHYRAFCTYLDDHLGRIMAALEQTGQAEDTIVIYTSDHGDYCAEHGLFAKGIPCFQGTYRVPLVMRWPAGIKNPGRRVASFASLADIAPTLLELGGINPGRGFTGASLAPFLANHAPAIWRDDIHTQCNGVELYYTQRSVMTNDYKYVFNGFDRDELYDLGSDPHEMINLADDRRYHEIKRAMCGRMWRFAYNEGDTALSPYITVGLAPFGPAEAFRQGLCNVT